MGEAMIWFAGSKEIRADMLKLREEVAVLRKEVEGLTDERDRRRARADWFLTKFLPGVGVLVVIVSTLNGAHLL